MKRKFIFLVILSFALSCNCSSKRKVSNKTQNILTQQNCIYDICFHNKPILIDSLLHQTNYNGILLKVYDINFDEQELKKSDSLLRKGYKRFPSIDWYEVPYLLKKHLNSNDSGYYKVDPSNGDRYIILNYTKHKFILYDMGLLIDLYREDSLKGKL